MIRETVSDGEPALDVDTEEEFARALSSGVYVVLPSWADALAWHPGAEENTDSFQRYRAADGTAGRSFPGDDFMNPSQVQDLLLRVLVRGGDTRLGRGQHYFHATIRREAPDIGHRSVMQAVWALIGQALAYIDYSQPAAENWELHLTEAGRAAALDEEVNPDNPHGYLKRLSSDIPGLSMIVRSYTEEALRAYNARLYRASTVMLGVASESAVLEVASSFAKRMPEAESKRFLETIKSRRQNIVTKFSTFRSKLESSKSDLPQELADGLDLTVNSVADLLRTYRNDAGHPTNRNIDRDDAYTHLCLFVRYARKLYALKAHCDRVDA